MAAHPIYKHMGALIAARRKTLKLKQETLSLRLGISRGSLANIETGRQNLFIHQLYSIAHALQLSPFDLLPQPISSPEVKESSGFSLPSGLSAQQREQVTRFVLEVDTDSIRAKEDGHAIKARKG